MIDLRPNPTRSLHALSKTRRPPTRPRGHRIACASEKIRAIHRRIKGTEEEESGGSRRRPKSVILRVHAPSPWPWRRPFLRAGGSVRHRQTAGKTPPAQSSQPSAEELRARSRTGTLKFRRNPWHWRDRTLLKQFLSDPALPIRDRSVLESILPLINRRRAELQQEAFDLGWKLYSEKPRAFVKRMNAYWNAWRSEIAAAQF